MSKTINILFIDEVHPFLQQSFESKGYTCDLDYTSDKNTLINKCKNYQGIIIRSRIPMDKEFLEANPQLMFIGRSGSGMENIDLPTAKALNIACFNAPEANKNAVAEHALGMILSLFNKLNMGDSDIRNGQWRREFHRGEEITGKTVGLIGYGNNGSAFAEKLRSFGCTILAYDKYKTGFGNDFVTEVDLDDLKLKSDIISLHIPQNKETRFMVNSDFINSCSKNFHLINTSRGKIVHTKSLVEAIENGKIKGACLDVLEFEKTSFSDLFDNENTPEEFTFLLNSNRVILSPHVAGWTHESYLRLSKVLSQKINQFLNYEA